MSETPDKFMTDKELEERVDHAFVKAGVKPLRPDGKDSLGQIEFDYPTLFGRDRKAEP